MFTTILSWAGNKRCYRTFSRRTPRLTPLLILGLVLCSVAAAGPPWPSSQATDETSAQSAKPGSALEAAKDKLLRKSEKPKKPYDKPAEAQEFFLLQRTGGEPLDYELIADAKKQAKTMPRAYFTSEGIEIPAPGEKAIGDILNWEELGPGNIGGRTRSLLIDPGDPNRMFAGGVSGGVWATTTGGADWFPLDDLMANLAVCSLSFAGQIYGVNLDTSIIYAGTGEGYFNGDAVRGAGIFKSVDGGATWNRLPSTNNPNFHYVNKIVASPIDVNTLYAATRTAIWKTTDAGATWVPLIENPSPDVGWTDIEIRTDTAVDMLVASCGSFIPAEVLGTGIYVSLDGGTTWEQAKTPPDNEGDPPPPLFEVYPGMGRSDLAIAPSSQTTIYALTADATATGDHRLLQVFRSDDGGQLWLPTLEGDFTQDDPSWLLLTNPIIANLGTCGQEGAEAVLNQGWYDNIIAVAPHNPNVVFAGGIDMFRSDDGGASWGPIGYWWYNPGEPEYVHADSHTIVFHPRWNGVTNQTVFVGGDGGMYRSDDALSDVGVGVCFDAPSVPTRVSWTNLNNNYGTIQFYHGRPIPDDPEAYFGGTQDNGTLYGDDVRGRRGWFEISGGDGGYVSYDSDNTKTRYVEFTGLSISRFLNGSTALETIVPNGIDEIPGQPDNFLFINPYRSDPNASNRLWTGGIYPWRTNNAAAPTAAGVRWVRAGDVTPGNGLISAWAIDPNNSNNVWCGMTDGFVIMTNQGTTATSTTNWREAGPPSATIGTYISWIEVDANDATGNTVYFTVSTYGAAHVWRTTDGGENWTDITGNLPDIPVHCIVIQQNHPENLFIGTELGVFVSKNTGATWANANDPGFTNTVVETLEITAESDLYAFTHGRGAFRAHIVSEADLPEITPSALTLDFEEQDLRAGPTAEQTLVIYNTGVGAPLNITSIGLAGTNASEFAIVTDTGESTVPPSGQRTLTLAFDPRTVGAKTARVVIRSNDDNEPILNVSLRGQGVSIPEIFASSVPEFPARDVDAGPSANSPLTIRNDGSAPLVVSSVAVTGSDAASFVITSGGGTFTLAAAEVRTLTVAFDPTSAGPKTANVEIVSNDADEGTLAVPLVGLGVDQEIEITPAQVAFGTQDIGAGQTVPQRVTITNIGNANLNISGVLLAGAHPDDFVVVNDTREGRLAPGASRLVDLAFDPEANGLRTVNLIVISDDTDEHSLQIGLRGTGSSSPEIVVDPASIDFGERNLALGATGPEEVTITNIGSAALSISGVTLQGPHASEFTLEGEIASSLDPGEEFVALVILEPATVGAKTASLRIASSDADEAVALVSLAATVTSPEITVTPAELDFGTQDIAAGATAIQSVTVTNEGNANLTINQLYVAGGDVDAFPIVEDTGQETLTPGATRRVDVAFDPTTDGEKSTTLHVFSSDLDESSIEVPLLGVGSSRADIVVAPGSVAFGNVNLANGSTTPQDVVLRSVGSATVDVTNVVVEGTNAAEFGFEGSTAASLAPGEELVLSVFLDPATLGAKTASLRFTTTDADGSDVVVALSGTVVSPEIAVSPVELNFGQLLLGQGATATLPVTLSNDGTFPLSVSSVSIVGDDAADFVIEGGGVAALLVPGEEQVVQVAFHPSTVGVKNAALMIASDDTDEASVSVALRGEAITPGIDVTPLQIDFRTVPLGQEVTVTIRSTGSALLELTSVGIAGGDAGAFYIASDTGQPALAPDTERVLAVGFDPASTGTFESRLRLESNALGADSVIEVVLQGEAIPVLSVEPTSLAFGPHPVGSVPSDTRTVAVRNRGTGMLAIGSVALSGAAAGEFQITSDTNQTSLAPGATRTIGVAFRPGSAGTKNATLQINSSNASSQSVALSGLGSAPEVSLLIDGVSASSAAFGEWSVEDEPSPPIVITVINSGQDPLEINEISITGSGRNAFQIVADSGETTLGAGERRTIPVVFAPEDLVEFIAYLRISTNDADEAVLVIELRGTGVTAVIPGCSGSAGTPEGSVWGEMLLALLVMVALATASRRHPARS